MIVLCLVAIGWGLVQFELPPEIRKEIALPTAVEGTVPLPEGRYVVEGAILRRNGEYVDFCDGQIRTLGKLKERLFVFSEIDRDDEHPMKPSRVPVVLYAAGATRWREVQWFMQACADPDVRIWKIHFAVESPEGEAVALPVFLPKDRGIVRSGTEPAPPLAVTLKRTATETATRFVLQDRPTGIDGEGFALLKQQIAPLVKENPDRDFQVNAWAEVPYADVVRVVAALRTAGAKQILFVGAPPKREVARDVQWRVPEEVRSKIVPPEATTGEEIPNWGVFLEIALTGEEHFPCADGRSMPLDALRGLLIRVSNGRRDRSHDPALSYVQVRILSDADAPWGEVRYLLQACADPQVLANRVSFLVRTGDEERILPVWLPVDEPPEAVAWLKVDLARNEAGETTVKLRGQDLGAGAKGLATLGAALRSVREKYPDRTIHGEIAPAKEVPYGDVVRAVDLLRKSDVTEIRFLNP